MEVLKMECYNPPQKARVTQVLINRSLGMDGQHLYICRLF